MENIITQKGITAKTIDASPDGMNCSAQYTNPNGMTNEKSDVIKYSLIETVSVWSTIFLTCINPKTKNDARKNRKPEEINGVSDSNPRRIASQGDPHIKQIKI